VQSRVQSPASPKKKKEKKSSLEILLQILKSIELKLYSGSHPNSHETKDDFPCSLSLGYLDLSGLSFSSFLPHSFHYKEEALN
jgi:hypothetical protein